MTARLRLNVRSAIVVSMTSHNCEIRRSSDTDSRVESVADCLDITLSRMHEKSAAISMSGDPEGFCATIPRHLTSQTLLTHILNVRYTLVSSFGCQILITPLVFSSAETSSTLVAGEPIMPCRLRSTAQ